MSKERIFTMKIYKSITELIGNTPLLQADNFCKENGINATILAKLEYFNPAGSAKDRIALSMIFDAIDKGHIKKGSTIIEPTSGNTGIGLASVAASMGYKVIFTMPETMSIERRKLLSAYGAEIVLTDGSKGMLGAIEKAQELSKEIEGSFIPGQFDNKANPMAHRETTGPEIWKDTEGKVDIVIAGIGTGGTISGTGQYLKEKNEKIKIIGIEPEKSPMITKGKSAPHGIQGIGANFVPDNFDKGIVDEVITISDEDAMHYAREFAKNEGILVGISSGAALAAACKIAKENAGKTIVVILPDSGERYLSTQLYS